MVIMYPLVIVQSFGEESSEKIIKEILKQSGQPEAHLKIQGFLAYECQVNTKYYNTKILLVNVEENLLSMPLELLKQVEAVFFYFDSQDKTFIETTCARLCKFVQYHNIQLATLLTRKLCDDETQGITYTNIKDVCKHIFDIIDLEEKTDPVDDNFDQYYEIWDMLKNHIWSTVNKSSDISDTSLVNNNMDNMEEQLNVFEELLTKVQSVRESSKTLTREELLNNAEHLAELLIKVMVDD